MSVLIRFSPSSLTVEQYDGTIQTLEDQGHWPPDGLDYHVCFGSEGSMKVSEIWDSREQLDAFGERLMPVLKGAGIDPGQPEIVDIHSIIRR